MHSARFAQTKIQPPRLRADLVARERIERPLAEALAHQRLVLLSAPAGFGKSAALTRQLAALPPGVAVAWVGADADDDLGRFVACLLAALEAFDPPWRSAPDAMVGGLDGGREAQQTVAAELVNALLATDVPRGLIVIDDAHRLDDPRIFEFLDLMIERLPHHWGVVVASRTDPPLALGRWRARGELAEFRQEQLRFTDDEVDRLLDGLPHARDRAELRELLARTEGWAAGLRLVLGSSLEASRAPMAASRRHLFDYLASEVIDTMPARLCVFLLRCSVLPELSAARCAEVSGDADAGTLLDQVEKRGLFVSALDEQHQVLRLHDLFRDFLEDRLRQELPDELPLLLRRAAAGETDPARRVGYLVQAGAWAEAEGVLCEVGPRLVAAGLVTQVLRMVEQLPAAWREASPRLAHLRALCAWAHWDIVTMCSALSQAAAGFEREGNGIAAQRSRVLEVIGLTAGGAVAQSVALLAKARQAPMDQETETTAWQAASWHALAAGRIDAVADALSHMVDGLEHSDNPMLWFQCVPPTSMIGMPGLRAPMQRYVDGARARTPAEPPTPLLVLAQILRAGLSLWAGEHALAARLLEDAEADCRWLHQPPNLIGHLHTYAALTHAVRGEAQAALAAADARLAGLVSDPRTSGRRAVWLNHFLFFKLRVAAALDDAHTLRALAHELEAAPNPAEPAALSGERATLPARLAAIDGRWADAAQGYEAALANEAALAMYGQAQEVRVRLAQALLQTGRKPEAARALAPLTGQVRASGGPGGVLLAGRSALSAVAAATWDGLLSPADQAALRSWAGTLAASAAGPAAAEVVMQRAPDHPPGSELLSSREREVLQRLASGDSNKLIARAFDLSPHTVKRHVANILDKLGLASRGQAAAWYHSQAPR
jgi:LuxR family transcriptional regulator, maltose regulon positive regulatory protein